MKVSELLNLMALWDDVLITDAVTAEELHYGTVERVPWEIRTKDAYAIHIEDDMTLHIEVTHEHTN